MRKAWLWVAAAALLALPEAASAQQSGAPGDWEHRVGGQTPAGSGAIGGQGGQHPHRSSPQTPNQGGFQRAPAPNASGAPAPQAPAHSAGPAAPTGAHPSSPGGFVPTYRTGPLDRGPQPPAPAQSAGRPGWRGESRDRFGAGAGRSGPAPSSGENNVIERRNPYYQGPAGRSPEAGRDRWRGGQPGGLGERPHVGRPPAGIPRLGDWNRNLQGADRDRARFEWRQRHNDWDRDAPWRRDRDWWRGNRAFRHFYGPRLGFFFVPAFGYVAVPPAYQYAYWIPGQYLPQWFWRYTVNDYWNYGLPAPPYGCAWVWVDNDIALIQLSDGYILDIVHNAW